MLLFDSEGKERVRLEGYLPNNDFRATLESGLGRIAFVHKRHADAERWYDGVVTHFGETPLAPAAMYWRAVTRYSGNFDHTVLGAAAEELQRRYPASEAAAKAIAWLPQPAPGSPSKTP